MSASPDISPQVRNKPLNRTRTNSGSTIGTRTRSQRRETLSRSQSNGLIEEDGSEWDEDEDLEEWEQGSGTSYGDGSGRPGMGGRASSTSSSGRVKRKKKDEPMSPIAVVRTLMFYLVTMSPCHHVTMSQPLNPTSLTCYPDNLFY